MKKRAELQEYEVALISVTELFDTSNPQGMLFLQMLGSFASKLPQYK